MYQRIKDQPTNKAAADVQQVTEHVVSSAFMQYLASSGPFADWKEEQAEWEQLMVSSLAQFSVIQPTNANAKKNDPIAVLSAFESQPDLAELVSFAKLLLKIVVNQVGCEQVFLDLKVKQTQCCNRLGLDKLAKMTKVSVNSMV